MEHASKNESRYYYFTVSVEVQWLGDDVIYKLHNTNTKVFTYYTDNKSVDAIFYPFFGGIVNYYDEFMT